MAYQSDPALTARLVDEVGSARVVQSDQPFYDPAAVFDSVLDAGLGQEDLQAVLYDNVAALIAARGALK